MSDSRHTEFQFGAITHQHMLAQAAAYHMTQLHAFLGAKKKSPFHMAASAKMHKEYKRLYYKPGAKPKEKGTGKAVDQTARLQ